MLTSLLRFAVVVLALPVIAACAATPAAGIDDRVATLLLKMHQPANADAVVGAVQSVLGRAAGVRYVRPMAGDAHVIYLLPPATREQVPALVERLRASGSFEYVELDALMKIQ